VDAEELQAATSCARQLSFLTDSVAFLLKKKYHKLAETHMYINNDTKYKTRTPPVGNLVLVQNKS